MMTKILLPLRSGNAQIKVYENSRDTHRVCNTTKAGASRVFGLVILVKFRLRINSRCITFAYCRIQPIRALSDCYSSLFFADIDSNRSEQLPFCVQMVARDFKVGMATCLSLLRCFNAGFQFLPNTFDHPRMNDGIFVSEDASCRDAVSTTGESMSAVQARQEEARRKRRKKKRSGSSLMSSCFQGKFDLGTYRRAVATGQLPSPLRIGGVQNCLARFRECVADLATCVIIALVTCISHAIRYLTLLKFRSQERLILRSIMRASSSTFLFGVQCNGRLPSYDYLIRVCIRPCNQTGGKWSMCTMIALFEIFPSFFHSEWR